MNYTVKTHDVDGSSTRRYKTRKAAVARFEEMLGYSLRAAIDEAYHMVPAEERPTPEGVRRVKGVSAYGTVVIFAAKSEA